MGRTSKPFALTPAEASALEAAREQFLAWHRDMPQLQPKALADLRKAARAMHRALAPVLDSVMNPTAARLLVRMQITELHQHSQDHYRQLLTWASYTAGLVDTAPVSYTHLDVYKRQVYTTDPRIVPEARRLKTISFEEMLEMASLGSKVLQIRSVEFAGKYRVPTRVLSSFTPWDIDLAEEACSGTLITFEEDDKMEQAVVAGIAFNRDEAKISVIGVPDKPGIAYQILGPVADANIDIDVIIQNVSHSGRTDFSFTVHRNDYLRTMELLKAQVLPVIGAAEVQGDAKICKVSIVGIGMRSHVGVASKMFRTLSDEGINIRMITTSEIKTSVVIDEKYMELAVRAPVSYTHLDVYKRQPKDLLQRRYERLRAYGRFTDTKER